MAFTQAITAWTLDQPHLGHKAPRKDRIRHKVCPACVGMVESPEALTSGHVLSDCMAVEATRIKEGIRGFIEECRVAGRSSATAHTFYITGKDKSGAAVPVVGHLQRGASLARLQERWLETWEQ